MDGQTVTRSFAPSRDPHGPGPARPDGTEKDDGAEEPNSLQLRHLRLDDGEYHRGAHTRAHHGDEDSELRIHTDYGIWIDDGLRIAMEREKQTYPGASTWAADEERLFEVLYLRQELPILPSFWDLDFRGFPISERCFSTTEDAKPIIYAHSREFRATMALTRLIDLTANVRTILQCGLPHKAPSMIRQALCSYISWAAQDGSYAHLKIVPNIIAEIVDPARGEASITRIIENRMRALARLQREYLKVERDVDFDARSPVFSSNPPRPSSPSIPPLSSFASSSSYSTSTSPSTSTSYRDKANGALSWRSRGMRLMNMFFRLFESQGEGRAQGYPDVKMEDAPKCQGHGCDTAMALATPTATATAAATATATATATMSEESRAPASAPCAKQHDRASEQHTDLRHRPSSLKVIKEEDEGGQQDSHMADIPLAPSQNPSSAPHDACNGPNNGNADEHSSADADAIAGGADPGPRCASASTGIGEEQDARCTYRRRPPVVYGLFIVNTSIFIMSVDSSRGKTGYVSFHVDIDTREHKQSVWNALTMAMVVCLARDEMMSRLDDFEEVVAIEEIDVDI